MAKVTPSRSTSLTLVEEQLKQALADTNRTVGSGEGAQKLKLLRDGTFEHPDGRNLGSEINCIVVDFLSANRWYPHTFNNDNPLPPNCFSFGRFLDEMGPYAESPEPQGSADDPPMCVGCPKNEWASDPGGGKGKACKNTRELALILEEDMDEETPNIVLLSVPPTSLQSFDGYVKLMSKSYGALPSKSVCRISTHMHSTYYKLSFVSTGIDNERYMEHVALRPETEDMLSRIPDVSNYVPSTERPNARKAAAPTKRAPQAARR